MDPVDIRKSFGVIYTPRPIVELMLDTYPGNNLQDVAVCDPACGDGEFLVPLVDRVCTKIKRASRCQPNYYRTLQRLTGFDVDQAAIDRCRERLDQVTTDHRIAPVQWNLRRVDAIDTTAWKPWLGTFDYVIGNPPYVRVQHLENHRRKRIRLGSWNFMSGACDLYLLFFDMALALLRRRGKVIFITPNSWLRSASGTAMRSYLRDNHRLLSVIDFGQHQVFAGATTYTAITAIEKQGSPKTVVPVDRCIGMHDGIPKLQNGYGIHTSDEKWHPMLANDRKRFFSTTKNTLRLADIASIHVGIQTLADDVFILPEGYTPLEPEILRRIYKASVMKNGQDRIERVIIYPYEDGRLLPEGILRERFPHAYRWLRKHKSRLLARDKGTFPPHKWYGYGREVSIRSGFGAKILTSGMNLHPNFQYCGNSDALFYSGYCVKPSKNVDVGAMLDQLNGRVMERYISVMSRPYQGGWFSYAKSFIQDFPVSAKVLKHA